VKIFREIPADSTGRPRWQFLAKKKINVNNEGVPQMIRYLIAQTPAFGLYVHKMLRPDGSRLIHDHPWRFRTLVLKGGYEEVYWSSEYPNLWLPHGGNPIFPSAIRRPFRTHAIPLTTAHTITRLLGDGPTWTVLLVGRKVKNWGFWHFGNHGISVIPWKQYRGIPEDPMDS
jgi:hypothetical protein